MTHELTIQSNAFTLTRVSKAGKESTRGLLGLIIEGNTAEREEIGLRLAHEAWDNGNLSVVAFELSRVFAGRNWDMAAAFVKLNAANPDKTAMLALMEALTRFFPEAKGVKAKYIRLCKDLVEFSKGEADRKEARRLAFIASQSNTVDAAA
jgi:hypothetical protein